MKIEIELNDASLQTIVLRAVRMVTGLERNRWDEVVFSTELAKLLQRDIEQRVAEQVRQADLRAMIDVAVERSTKPLLEEAIKVALKAKAKEAVKAAMQEAA